MNRITEVDIVAVEVKVIPTAKGSYKKMELTYKAFNTFTKKVDTKTAHLVDFKATPDLWEALENSNKGDTLKILETKDDKYWNFSALATDEDIKQVNSQPQGTTGTSGARVESNDGRQQSIVRQSSLAQAVQFSKDTDGITVDDVLDTAAKFEDWVNR